MLICLTYLLIICIYVSWSLELPWGAWMQPLRLLWARAHGACWYHFYNSSKIDSIPGNYLVDPDWRFFNFKSLLLFSIEYYLPQPGFPSMYMCMHSSRVLSNTFWHDNLQLTFWQASVASPEINTFDMHRQTLTRHAPIIPSRCCSHLHASVTWVVQLSVFQW